MNILRPRNLALAFLTYFVVVCYYAAQEGRRAILGAYGPAISQTVFQTTMVGGVLVLLSIFITASISPYIKGAATSRSSGTLGALRVIRRIRGESDRMPDDYRMGGRRRGPGRGSLGASATRRTGQRHIGSRPGRTDRGVVTTCAPRHRANEGLDAASPCGRDDRR